MKLITVKELSELLKIKESTLYSWASKGSLPSFRLNGLLRFDFDEIKKWVKQSRNAPDSVDMAARRTTKTDIDMVIKKAIESVRKPGYNSPQRGNQTGILPGKEVDDGTL